jgi:hypothetical protein
MGSWQVIDSGCSLFSPWGFADLVLVLMPRDKAIAVGEAGWEGTGHSVFGKTAATE